MSKIFKKSLSIILAVALCFTAMVGCFTAYADETTERQATYVVTAGTVASDGKATVTVSVSSALEANLGAVLLDLVVPGVPLTSMTANSNYDLTTTVNADKTEVRALLLSKVVGTNYTNATLTLVFDTSAKALVDAGFDPDVNPTLEVSVWGASAAKYGTLTNNDEPENQISVTPATNATLNDVGKPTAFIKTKNTCTHSYTSVVTLEPTCTALGTKTHTCSKCGRVYTSDIPMLEHAFDNGVITLEPTCAVAGNKRYTCADCGFAKNEAVKATGEHVYPETYEGNEDKWTVDEGDCLTEVSAHPNCLVCGTPDMSVSVPVGFGPHAVDEVIWESEPTCGQEGRGTGYCLVCWEEVVYTTPATGEHTYDDGAVTKKPTCGEDGVKTFTCGTCGDTYTEAIPAAGEHTYNDGVVTTKPTCTTDGVKTFTCSACGDSYTETIPASGEHTYDDGVVTTQPTCTTDGVKTFTCGACGDSYTEAVPASGAHTAAAAAYENNAETGCYDAVVKCSACGEDITRLATDIPNGTKVNNSITVTPYVFITDSVGVMTMLKKSQLSSYSTYAVRFARQAFNNSYNYYMEYDEINEFTGKSSPYCINANVALFEMALPMAYSVCGYDANGNLVAVSKPYITTITDLLWANYSADTEKNKPMYLDLINMGSYAQDYFASQQKNPCDLSTALRPADAYAFDQNYASPSVPEYNTATLPNSTVNGKVIKDTQNKTCTINNKMLNLAGAAPTLQYMIRYGARVADPSLWSVTYSYDSASGKTITGSLSGVGDANTNLHTSGTYAYALIAPALYDSDKTVTAVFKYNGEVVFTDSYSVDTWIAATIPTLTTDNETSRLVNTIAKFGVSVRNYFLKV